MSRVRLILSELRKDRGITQSDLAEHLGVSFQSVSKWETGASMPDITLLPMLAEYFNVSVDELLGLKPLKKREYIARKTDSSAHRNSRLEYLKDSRLLFWNDDYLEFLINKVWKITKPVNLLDFGCGCGFLGLALLPFLPKDSTYTGIDIGETLIAEGRRLFEASGYNAEFILSDLNQFNAEKQYDMVICQALLRHMPYPGEILKKMIDSASAGGWVVCIEVNRELENAGLYINGLEYNPSATSQAFQKFWKTELSMEGRDYAIGMKIPFYMQEYGLTHIDVRMNDRVNFVNPYSDEEKYSELLNALIKTNDWDRTLSEDKKEDMITFFMSRGLSRSEAETYLLSNIEKSRYIQKNKEAVSILKAHCLLVSYGRKV